MSDKCPPGVRYFGYKASPNKGKYAPADVNGGQSQVQSAGGGIAGPSMSKAKGKPAGGTEHYTTVKHYNAKLSGPTAKSGANAVPEGVRKFGGGKVK